MSYKVFISYSHAADNKLAPAIEMGLRRFARPVNKIRAMNVFRDKTSLQMTNELWDNIAKSLRESEYFILMASPQSAASEWVQKEINEWLTVKDGSLEKFLIVLTDGEIFWDKTRNDFDWDKTTALPTLLKGNFQKEPLFLDFKWTKERADALSLRNPDFGDGIATLSATLHGRNKADLIGEDVRSHRIFKRSVVAAISFAFLFFIAVGLTIYAYYQTSIARGQTIEAEKQKNIAEEEKVRANEQEKIANSERKVAITQSELADKNKEEAEKQAKIAGEQSAEADKQRQIADTQRKEADKQKEIAVRSEKEAQTQRTIAKAREQVTYASRLAVEGYKRLAEGDKASAQTFFAEAVNLDDQEEYRAGLLSASFNSGNESYKLSWSKEVADDIETSCCSASALSFNGELLAVSYNDGGNVRVLKTRDGNEISKFTFEKEVVDIALSANGEYIAVKNEDGQIDILETATQDKYFEFKVQPDESLLALVFSNDNKYFAAISGSSSIVVVDLQNKKVIKNITHENEFSDAKIYYLTFIPDNLIAYAFNHGPIIITSIENETVNKRVNMWAAHLGLGFTRKGELITSSYGNIEIYPRIKENFAQSWVPDSKDINKKVRPDWLIATNSSVDYFVSTGDNGIINFRNGTEQINQISFSMGKPVNLMLGQNGKVLFQNTKGKIYCWEVITPDYKKYELAEDALYATGFIRGVERKDGTILVKDIKSEEVIFSLKLAEPNNKLTPARISEDGKTLVVSQDGRSVETYNVESGKKLFQYSLEEKDKVGQIIFLELSNDGNKIAALGTNSIIIISIPDSKILATLDFPLPFSKNFYVDSLSFSPQDNFFVIQSENSINLFDVSTGKLQHSIPFLPKNCPEGVDVCSWIAISPDEKFVGLTTFEKGIVQLWSIANYRYLVDVIQTGVESPERAVGAAFTKDSRFLIWSSGGSGRLHFYDVRENKKLSDFPIGEGIEALGIIPSGQLVINGDDDYYIIDEKNITSLLQGTPGIINSQVYNKTGFKVDSMYKPEFTQDQLNSILKNDRPRIELVGIDQKGLTVKGEKDFGGVEIRKWKNGQCPTGFYMPAFNPFNIDFNDQKRTFCSDLPMIDVTKDTRNPRFAQSKEEYYSVRKFKEGDRLAVLLYIDNGAYSKPDPNKTVAKNVRILTSLTSNGNLHKITATFSADNAAPLAGSVTVQTNADEYLEIIPNSGFMYDYEGRVILDRQNLNLGNSSFILGDLDADWEYSLSLSYKIIVKKKR